MAAANRRHKHQVFHDNNPDLTPLKYYIYDVAELSSLNMSLTGKITAFPDNNSLTLQKSQRLQSYERKLQQLSPQRSIGKMQKLQTPLDRSLSGNSFDRTNLQILKEQNSDSPRLVHQTHDIQPSPPNSKQYRSIEPLSSQTKILPVKDLEHSGSPTAILRNSVRNREHVTLRNQTMISPTIPHGCSLSEWQSLLQHARSSCIIDEYEYDYDFEVDWSAFDAHRKEPNIYSSQEEKRRDTRTKFFKKKVTSALIDLRKILKKRNIQCNGKRTNIKLRSLKYNSKEENIQRGNIQCNDKRKHIPPIPKNITIPIEWKSHVDDGVTSIENFSFQSNDTLSTSTERTEDLLQ